MRKTVEEFIDDSKKIHGANVMNIIPIIANKISEDFT